MRRFLSTSHGRGALYSPPPLSLALAPAADSSPSAPRALSVSIVGEPNAGKSSLLNALVCAPLSAVSRKYNTTSSRVLGVTAVGRTQLVFTDTPGLMQSPSSPRFQRTLVAEARNTVPSSDVVLLVVDIARRLGPASLATMDALIALAAASRVPVVIAANKADLLRGAPLSSEQAAIAGRKSARVQDVLALKLLLLQEWFEAASVRAGVLGSGGFDAEYTWVRANADTVVVTKNSSGAVDNGSAHSTGDTAAWPASRVDSSGALWLRSPSLYSTARVLPVHAVSAGGDGAGVDDLRAALVRAARPRAWEYSAGTITDRAPAEVVADAVRGALFERLHEEVPYRIWQETRSWRGVVIDAQGRLRDDEYARQSRLAGAARRSGAMTPAARDARDTSVALALSEWDSLASEVAHVPRDDAALSLQRAVIVHQDICVPSSGVAAMLLAREGRNVAAIAKAAAEQATKVLGVRVLLKLHVRVVHEKSRARAAS